MEVKEIANELMMLFTNAGDGKSSADIARDLVNELNELGAGGNKVADSIYRKVWKDHVMEDVKDRINDAHTLSEDDDINCIAEDVADAYIYEGDYDCNIDYWSQLDKLIERFIETDHWLKEG